MRASGISARTMKRGYRTVGKGKYLGKWFVIKVKLKATCGTIQVLQERREVWIIRLRVRAVVGPRLFDIRARRT